MNLFSNTQSLSAQLAQCEQLIHQLVQQTQQASVKYQQLLQQEQRNAEQLEQLAQRERQAAHIIQTALQGHQTALQQLQQISSLCNQMASSASRSFPGIAQPHQPTAGYSVFHQ
ncbi:AMP-dependent synthetase and ligase [Brevibacillus brevis]|uniref:AMP-dependent synthetase and ligase n=1 Tax=Brevibacillus brevis TaxID=1393 RepID=A0ABY9SX31_BREBE|nr:AMP-dependent synthetase and ligase [Brevibacillus brevis]WNC12107.1 AMP-dependent synthetase and ligase [Brevibacillus brevis]